MHSRIASFAILSSLFIFSSCRNADDTTPEDVIAETKVQITFDTQWEGGDFNLQEVYFDNFGNRIRVDSFKSYISMLSIVKEDGSEVLLHDFYLMDFLNPNTYTFTIEPGDYDGIRFGIGVPQDYNKDEDPAQYPNDHPLSVAGSQGMFWHWNTGYIFVKFEGKADTTGTEGAELLHSFSFHIGDDPYFRSFEQLDTPIHVEAGLTTAISVNIHVDQILATGGADDIDLATDAITHTSGNTVLAATFVNNFDASITVE